MQRVSTIELIVKNQKERNNEIIDFIEEALTHVKKSLRMNYFCIDNNVNNSKYIISLSNDISLSILFKVIAIIEEKSYVCTRMTYESEDSVCDVTVVIKKNN